MRLLYNPFYLYVITFSTSLFFFSLHWSGLYPELNSSLLFFFLLTFMFSILFGILYDKGFKVERFNTKIVVKRNDFLYAFIVISIIVEFIYTKGIPILMLSDAGIEYNYKDFGIKTFHVFIFTLISFYTLFLFQRLLQTKKIVVFIKFLSLYIYPILIMNRGSLVIISIGMILIYIILKRKIRLQKLLFLLLFLVSLLYVFGLLGNIRQNDKNYMMRISEPTDEFTNSNIPSEFMWSYIYVSSPVATLQLNMEKRADLDLPSFITGSILPDFISKHLRDGPIEIKKIKNWLTVGTVYSKAYHSLGWVGVWCMFFLMSIFTLVYTYLLPKNSPYSLIGYSVLLTIIIFSVFSNMWVFSGLSLQLIYPFILGRFKLA